MSAADQPRCACGHTLADHPTPWSCSRCECTDYDSDSDETDEAKNVEVIRFTSTLTLGASLFALALAGCADPVTTVRPPNAPALPPSDVVDVVHDPPASHGAELARFEVKMGVHTELGRHSTPAEETSQCDWWLKPRAQKIGAKVVYVQPVEAIPNPDPNPMHERAWCRGVAYAP